MFTFNLQNHLNLLIYLLRWFCKIKCYHIKWNSVFITHTQTHYTLQVFYLKIQQIPILSILLRPTVLSGFYNKLYRVDLTTIGDNDRKTKLTYWDRLTKRTYNFWVTFLLEAGPEGTDRHWVIPRSWLCRGWMWGVLLWIWNCLLNKKQTNPTYRFLADCESWFVSLALRFLPVVTMRGVWAIAVGWSGVVRCSCELLLRTIFRIPLNISVNEKPKHC